LEKRKIEKVENSKPKPELEARTLEFAVPTIRFVSAFPKTDAALMAGRQLLRSATSIGANDREANRAESREDFIHKAAIAQKEAAETDYWLEICLRTKLGESTQAIALSNEAREPLAIFTTINRKAKGR
jgi:four helix bundle protein